MEEKSNNGDSNPASPEHKPRPQLQQHRRKPKGSAIRRGAAGKWEGLLQRADLKKDTARERARPAPTAAPFLSRRRFCS